jgi:restriction system protein
MTVLTGGMNTRVRPDLPEDLSILAYGKQCPYCLSSLVTRTEEDEGWDLSSCAFVRCRHCTWWRRHNIPDHYFLDTIEVGALSKLSRVAPRLLLAIREIKDDRNRLYCMDPLRFESFARDVFRAFYDCDVVHVGKSHDGGIDLLLLDSIDGKIPIQVKRRADPGRVESVAVVREFRGAMLLAGEDEGIVVTTADHFSKEARHISKPDPVHLIPQTVHLIDCRRLLDILDIISRQ